MSVRNQFDYYREVDGDVARIRIHGKDGRPDIAVQLNRIVQRKYL